MVRFSLLALSLAVLPLAACTEAGDKAGAPAADKAAADKATPTATAKLTLPVEGMTCEGCESAIRGAVSKLDGVVSCTASHTEKQAVIEYDPAKVKPEKLSEVIAGLGYKVGAPAN